MAQQGGVHVGNIGMYYASYRLSQQCWNVMPTGRNARGVDPLTYSVNAHIYKGIQVTALSKGSPSRSAERLMDLLVIDGLSLPMPALPIRCASS